MRIKNRLSPYPMLDNFGDDYIDSSFTAEFDVYNQFSEVYGKITFHLQNKELEELIADKKAVFTVHIECPSTCYREAKSSEEPEIEFKISSSLLSKKIEIRTFLILTEVVTGFSSEKFHPDYKGQTFDFEAHQIVGIGTAMDYKVKKDDRDLDALPSIIRIVKLENARKGTMTVNTDNDEHILVGLTGKAYELYARLGKHAFKSSAFSLVLLPALVIILQRMCLGKDDSAVNSLHWYEVIESLLNQNGYQIDNLSIENDSLLSVCQAIFADPIDRSLKELESWSERE